MAAAETNGADGSRSGADPEELGLRALVWTLADPRLAMRLIEVTGIDPRDLKTRLREPAVLAATLGFLESHEPDLVACAAAVRCAPGDLVAARAALEAA